METRRNPERCAILADVAQLYGWATRGMVVSGAQGAGYSNKGLSPQRITYLNLPIALDTHFPDEMGRDFPILIEPNLMDLANRCVLSMADVATIHFRTQEEKEQYLVTSTPSFGMSDDLYSVSPELFANEGKSEIIFVNQRPFDQMLFDRLEAWASVTLFLKFVASDLAGIDFLHAMIGGTIDLNNELLAAVKDEFVGTKASSPDDLHVLTDCLLEVMSKQVLTSKSDSGPDASLGVLDLVRESTDRLSFIGPEFANFLAGRLQRLREIVVSSRTLASLPAEATPERKLLYALLISLIRPGTSDFVYWLRNEEAAVDVQLTAAVFVGLRNHRWRILDRTIRSEPDEIQLSRAISVAMSLGTGQLQLDSSFLPHLPDSPESKRQDPSIGRFDDLVISGTALRELTQTFNEDGSFTLRIVAGSLILPAQSNMNRQTSPDTEVKPKKSTKEPPTRRKALGSAMKESVLDLFPDKSD